MLSKTAFFVSPKLTISQKICQFLKFCEKFVLNLFLFFYVSHLLLIACLNNTVLLDKTNFVRHETIKIIILIILPTNFNKVYCIYNILGVLSFNI